MTEMPAETSKEVLFLKKALLGILVGMILVLTVILVVILIKNPKSAGHVEERTEAGSGEEKETGNKADGKQEEDAGASEKKDDTKDGEGASSDENKDKAAEEEDEYTLMVAVPADEINIRTRPGFDDDDSIAVLQAGTYLKWYGETETAEDKDFYRVKLRDDDTEGYINADYCVKAEFVPDMDELDIVGIENTLYTYDIMTDDIEKLCDKYPDIIRSRVPGQSADGRDIYELTLGNPKTDNHIFMQATIHGREYINSQLMMKLLEYYAHYYDTAAMDHVTYRDIFDQTCIHVVPMANPDGVVISAEGVDRLNNDYFKELVYNCYERDKYDLIYEKNTNGDWNWSDKYKDETFVRSDEDIISYEEYQKLWKANANGVDLNRNYDVGWEDLKCRYYESYSDFKGYYPSSEPETQILMDLATEREYKVYISYHSMGQMIYYDAEGNSQEVSDKSTELAQIFNSWLKYKIVSNKKAYNVVLGGFGDWVQLSLGYPSITVESGKHPCPTQVEEFLGIWFRHMESWARLARQYYKQ